jgi:hypothetical protein
VDHEAAAAEAEALGGRSHMATRSSSGPFTIIHVSTWVVCLFIGGIAILAGPTRAPSMSVLAAILILAVAATYKSAVLMTDLGVSWGIAFRPGDCGPEVNRARRWARVTLGLFLLALILLASFPILWQTHPARSDNRSRDMQPPNKRVEPTALYAGDTIRKSGRRGSPVRR